MTDPLIKKIIILSLMIGYVHLNEINSSSLNDSSTNSTSILNETEASFSDSNGRSLLEDLPRQGRIINDEKISIKGFIPIVGIGGGDDDKKNDDKRHQYQYHSSTSERNQHSNNNNNNNDNPNSYDDGQQHYPQHQSRPEDQRFIGAALQGLIGNVGSFTRGGYSPFKPQQQQQQFQRKSDCVCVPFYMCRNGFIVGSASDGNNNPMDPYQGLFNQQHFRKPEQQDSYSYPALDNLERSLDDSNNLNNTKFAEEILGRISGRQSSSMQDRCGILRTCCQRSNPNSMQMISNEMINSDQFIPPELIANANIGYGHPSQMYRPPQMIESQYHQQPQMVAGYPTVTIGSSQLTQRPPVPLSPPHQPQHYRPPKLINAASSQMMPSFDSNPHYQPSSFIRPQHHPQAQQQHHAYNNCGARQSIGINGRVQNLNYHQSSAEFGEFPWQVAILKRIGPSDNLYVCGGALISSSFVLTAAHCIKKFQPQDLKIRLGEWDVHREDEFYAYVEKNVDEVFIHPNFVPRNLQNDVAILKLDQELDLSQHPHISPICMPQPFELFAGQRCYVAGWGKNAFGQQGEYQSVLMKVDLPIIDSRRCEQQLQQTKLGYGFRLDRSMICAGGEHGKDACEGDGGSGLVCEHNGIWKVAGLVSWGLGCGQAGVPGVYTNVGHVRSWIDKIVLPYYSSINQRPIHHHSYPNFNELINERSLGNDTMLSINNENNNQTTTITTDKPTN